MLYSLSFIYQRRHLLNVLKYVQLMIFISEVCLEAWTLGPLVSWLCLSGCKTLNFRIDKPKFEVPSTKPEVQNHIPAAM